MKLNTLKKISAICLVLAVSAAAWACGGKGGGCGDKDRKDTTIITTHAETEHLTAYAAKGGKGGGCGGGTKDCPGK